MLTREVPFKGLEGLQVAWLVVEKNEVRLRFSIQVHRSENSIGFCKGLFHLLQIESKFTRMERLAVGANTKGQSDVIPHEWTLYI